MLVRRATVRSRAKLSYRGVQAELDAGTAAPVLQLLKEVGIKRVELERLRGGASLNMPEQEIEQLPDGGYRIAAAPPLPVEDWNAQISLMTGMAAAEIMLAGKVGILRTMPAPDEASLAHFHRQTRALGKPWDGEMSYGEYLRTLDPTDPRQLAIVHSAGMLFRGAGYTPFDGTVPEAATQAAIGAAYAHSTAPLRRLIDRFVLVICEALSNGTAVPAWAREALPSLPAIMATSDQLAAKLERLSLDTVEAALLVNHIGQEFDAVVISGSKPPRNGKAANGKTANGNGKPQRERQRTLRDRADRRACGHRPLPRRTGTRHPGPGADCVLRHCHPRGPAGARGLTNRRCSRAPPAVPVEDPGRVQLDWKGRYGCPVVDFLDFRIQQARPYAILR